MTSLVQVMVQVVSISYDLSDGGGGCGGNGVMLGLFSVLLVFLEWVVDKWREIPEDGNGDSTTFLVWTEDIVTL